MQIESPPVSVMIPMFLMRSRLLSDFHGSIAVGIIVILLSAECQGIPINDSWADEERESHHSGGVTISSWEYDVIKGPLIYTIVLLLAGICKIGYHHANFLSSKVPESCILIALGIGVGVAIRKLDAPHNLPEFFKPHEFFMFLLPPIILEASYSLHNRAFGDNIGSILLLAVMGTVLAAAFAGLSLFFLAKAGAMGDIVDVGFVEIMVFASLIVAVDPVAVLAVFQEIGVNRSLYFLVFGESLLNDGVTVVLYKVFQAYHAMDEITSIDFVLGFIKFFTVCIGGVFIGLLSGLASALLTKVSQRVQVAQPMIIYTLAYLGYLLAEAFELSGIISLVVCGLTQRQYAFFNISDTSTSAIKFITNVMSTTCEIIIFLFLGMSVASADHDFHGLFVCWTIGLCLVYRFLIVFGITSLVNRLNTRSVRKIGRQEQFIIAYGGLRGAVCFSLVALLEPDDFLFKQMFVTTTLAVIIFTVFVQGTTIKPLVYLMKIRLAPEKDNSLFAEFQNTVTDHMMTGIDGIIGDPGRNQLREKLIYFNDKHLHPILTKPSPAHEQLKQLHDHLLLKEHVKFLKLSGAKSMRNAPDLPRVSTELILSSKGFYGPDEDEIISPEESHSVDLTSNLSVPADTVQSSASMMKASEAKTTKSEAEVVDVKGLRDLFQSQKSWQFALSYRDGNLPPPGHIGADVEAKLQKNKRLQKISHKWTDEEGSTAMPSALTPSPSYVDKGDTFHERQEEKMPIDIQMKRSNSGTTNTIATVCSHEEHCNTKAAPTGSFNSRDKSLNTSESRNEQMLSAVLSKWRKHSLNQDDLQQTDF